jgi:DNA-binding transcriptional LysR family regulator
MRTGLSMDLLPGFERSEFDLVIACRSMAFKDGGLLYRDSLIWVAAPNYELRLDRTVPLVTLPPHCTHRGLCLQALDQAGIGWEIVYVSSSTAGVQAAVRGGLGIAMIPQSAMIPELRTLTPAEGVPELPDFEIAIFPREDPPPPSARAFIDFLTEEAAIS